MFYDLESGLELVESANSDTQNVTLCGGDDRYLIWTLNEDGYSRLNVRDLHQNRTLDIPEFPEGIFSIDCQGSPAKLAITINGWKTPGNIWVWDLASETTHEVFAASMAGLDPERLIRPESLSIAARDGVQLEGLLYLPDESSRLNTNPPPIVFLVHGGPTGQSRPRFNAIVQYHVDRGMAVFEPNVRGSTGFGHTYSTLDDSENRLNSVRDLVDMQQYLNRDPRVDASRAAERRGQLQLNNLKPTGDSSN
jgi:dipeptidyl aminopeptidase/acylaminoacyl peptidase